MLPGSEHACKELMEMCLQFLCARYPTYFSLDLSTLIFTNKILNTTTDIKSMPPLEVLLHNVPEDFAIMLRDPETGFYSFRAGMICSSLGWNLGTKMGMRLHEIHQPIPDYKEKMQFSMDRLVPPLPSPPLTCPSIRNTKLISMGQILYQETDGQIHPTRLVGSRSRHTPLHATR